MRERLRGIVETRQSAAARTLDTTTQTLIVVSIVVFSVQTLPGLAPGTAAALDAVEAAIIVVFTIEYGLRLWAAKRALAFATSFYGVVDLLTVLPFWLAFGLDVQALRSLRLLRLFQLLKLARYGRALGRLREALALAREEIVLYLTATVVLLFIAAAGVYEFEHEAQPEHFGSIFDGLWWAVVTLTTVGYGDVYPITTGGRAFTFVLLFVGIGVVTVPAGIVASSLSRAREREREGR